MFAGLLLNDPCVIYKPKPVPWRVWRQTGEFFSQNTPYTDWQLWGLLETLWPLLQPVHSIYFERKSKYYADRTTEVQ